MLAPPRRSSPSGPRPGFGGRPRIKRGGRIAWNASGPQEFLSGYSSTAIVERLDGDCLISTGLDGYVLRGNRWEKVQKAPYSWHNARHGSDGILTATENP